MRVSGTKDTGFAVAVRCGSPRVFLRLGFQRYAATPEEAVELAHWLLDAVDALRDGREFVQSYNVSPRDGGDDAA